MYQFVIILNTPITINSLNNILLQQQDNNLNIPWVEYLHKAFVKVLIAYDEVGMYTCTTNCLLHMCSLPLYYDVKPLSLISFSFKSIIGMYLLCITKVVVADNDISGNNVTKTPHLGYYIVPNSTKLIRK